VLVEKSRTRWLFELKTSNLDRSKDKDYTFLSEEHEGGGAPARRAVGR